MKEEYIKLINSIKDKTGFVSEQMKIQASKDILEEVINWADSICNFEIKNEKLLHESILIKLETKEDHINIIKEIEC